MAMFPELPPGDLDLPKVVFFGCEWAITVLGMFHGLRILIDLAILFVEHLISLTVSCWKGLCRLWLTATPWWRSRRARAKAEAAARSPLAHARRATLRKLRVSRMPSMPVGLQRASEVVER